MKVCCAICLLVLLSAEVPQGSELSPSPKGSAFSGASDGAAAAPQGSFDESGEEAKSG